MKVEKLLKKSTVTFPDNLAIFHGLNPKKEE